MNSANYTPEQLEIVHKLTIFKYNPSKANLITLQEYEKLDAFLKGYAFYLQADCEGTNIPAYRIKSLEFQDGYERAKTEVGTLSLNRREITDLKVKAIIQSELRKADLPMNESFHNLGLSSNDLRRVQIRLIKAFSRTVSELFFNDTIYTVTSRLNGKANS